MYFLSTKSSQPPQKNHIDWKKVHIDFKKSTLIQAKKHSPPSVFPQYSLAEH